MPSLHCLEDLFHNIGPARPALAKDLSPHVFFFDAGLTNMRCDLLERRDLVGLYGVSKSDKYLGAIPCTHLNTRHNILNWTLINTCKYRRRLETNTVTLWLS